MVAEDEVTASRALHKIKVEYEEYPVVIDPKKSMYGSRPPVHFDKKDNVLVRSNYFIGDVDGGLAQSDLIVKRHYKTPMVQHCHIENPVSYAYMDKETGILVGSCLYPDSLILCVVSSGRHWESPGEEFVLSNLT